MHNHITILVTPIRPIEITPTKEKLGRWKSFYHLKTDFKQEKSQISLNKINSHFPNQEISSSIASHFCSQVHTLFVEDTLSRTPNFLSEHGYP